jgi:hypothetical protein
MVASPQQIKIISFNKITKEKVETKIMTYLLEEFCKTNKLSFIKINKQINACAKEERPFVVSVSYELTYMFELV